MLGRFPPADAAGGAGALFPGCRRVRAAWVGHGCADVVAVGRRWGRWSGCYRCSRCDKCITCIRGPRRNGTRVTSGCPDVFRPRRQRALLGRHAGAARGLRGNLGSTRGDAAAALGRSLCPRGLALFRPGLHLALQPRGPSPGVSIPRRRCEGDDQSCLFVCLPSPARRAWGPGHLPRRGAAGVAVATGSERRRRLVP